MYAKCDVLRFVCAVALFLTNMVAANQTREIAMHFITSPFSVYLFIIATSKVCTRRFLPYSNRPGSGWAPFPEAGPPSK